MNVETLVYGYLFVCICVVIFDIFYLARTQYVNWLLPRKVAYFQLRICEQLYLARNNAANHSHFIKKMKRKLRNPAFLIAFMSALEQERNEWGDLPLCYMQELVSLFSILARYYRRKAPEYRAYFAYVVAVLRFGIYFRSQAIGDKSAMELTRMAQVLLQFLNSDSIHLRENTFKALLSMGNLADVLAALRILNNTPQYINQKLLADGLLTFAGDQPQLAVALWMRFESFCPELQVEVVNYLRLLPFGMLEPSVYTNRMCQLLRDNHAHKEVRIATLRYFRRHPSPDVYDDLVRMVTAELDEQSWEYAAVAASVLSAYPGEQTRYILTDAICSPNWYVRFNAAESLVALGGDLAQINLEHLDEYGSSMLRYRSQIHELKENVG